MEPTKKCTGCNTNKPITHFVKCKDKSKAGKLGVSSRCKPCRNLQTIKWRLLNKEKLKRDNKTRYWKNRDAQLEYCKKWRAQNKERVKFLKDKWKKENPIKHKAMVRASNKKNSVSKSLRDKEYRKLNPEKISAHMKNRKARARMATAKSIQTSALVSLFKPNCEYCGVPTPKPTLDHVVPLKNGGKHEISNLKSVCLSCNASKGSKSLGDFIKYKQDICEPLIIKLT